MKYIALILAGTLGVLVFAGCSSVEVEGEGNTIYQSTILGRQTAKVTMNGKAIVVVRDGDYCTIKIADSLYRYNCNSGKIDGVR